MAEPTATPGHQGLNTPEFGFLSEDGAESLHFPFSGNGEPRRANAFPAEFSVLGRGGGNKSSDSATFQEVLFRENRRHGAL